MKTPALALAMFLLNTMAISAQVAQVTVPPLTDEDIKLIRLDVQTVKDDVINHTMQFSDTEAAKFWPVYKEYAAEQRAIAEKRFAIILDYAKTIDTLTDEGANSLTQRLFQSEDDSQALRKRYFPKFEATIGAKRAAKFYQVDNRLTTIINLRLASEIPLIP